MEETILSSVKLRPGISNNSDELLMEFITDSIQDVKDFIKYKDDEDIPSSCISVVKELVVMRCNRLGVEGLSSSSNSGVSESYIDDLPKLLKRKLYKHRRLF